MTINYSTLIAPMPTGDIDQAFVQTFEDNVRHLAQQKVSKLMDHCQYVNRQSESHNWERLAKRDDVLRKHSRTANADGSFDTPVSSKPFSKRRTNVDTYDVGDLVELEDITQMLTDPNSNLVRNQAYQMARQMDRLMIAGAWKPASIKGSGMPEVFPTSQEIGDGTTPISFDFVTEVSQKFWENDVEQDVRKCMVIGPRQARKLLQITEATNADYTLARDLESKGIVTNWMGYDWIVSNRLSEFDPTEWGMTESEGPEAGEIWCMALSEFALGYHSSQELFTRVQEDPSASFAWRIYSAFTADCVRVEDEHIFKLRLLDSIV